ncbi:MAG: ComF family protein [Betaproteobacteria bacterium]|jgi:ComF family protein|nr:ComF family protein [Betaproteobacteria bacterium]
MGGGLSIYRTTIQALARLLPQNCFVCGQQSGVSQVCPDCAAAVPYLTGPLCPVCALPTPDGSICGACQNAPPHYDATSAPFPYAFPVAHLIQGLKYRHRLPLAGWLANALALCMTSPRVDCILPLPLSAQRMKERGFNQAQEIARPLALRLDVPLMSDACIRVLNGAPQASLPWKARQANIRNAFECRIDLTGKSVAVVDDVMTTGATLNEFARTLKLHGARRVENWVAARTLPG